MNYRIPSIFILFFVSSIIHAQLDEGINHYSNNSSYWQYRGKPILLLGGSSEDNLFQIENLEEELTTIKNAGGNYVRNTLSSRDSGNVWAFGADEESGKYDLNKWNDKYWRKLEEFLKLTHQLEIIVQMELWATFDFYKDNWDLNPFNPKNNINYTSKRTKIAENIPTHPIFCDNRFFWSVPMHDNNMPVLEYQQKFIDKVLSYSLKYDNILYCIDNETSVTAAWGKFWSEYIRKRAEEKGKSIHVTEMWDPHDLSHISHRETFDHPKTYSFVEISQNNHQLGQKHWDNGVKQINRLKIKELKRPVNNVKTYGNDLGKHGHGSQNGKESFIRSIFFGSASARFHRPNSGLGISNEAQKVINSTRKLTSRMDFINSEVGSDIIHEREENEAYCRFIHGKQYAVFFTDGGEIELEIPNNLYSINWLRIENAEWLEPEKIKVQNMIKLKTPSTGLWFVYLEQIDE